MRQTFINFPLGEYVSYIVHYTKQYLLAGLVFPKGMHFSTAIDLPLPNPAFPHMRATCCKIAQLSGGYLGQVLHDLLHVLSEDGAPADVLIFALQYPVSPFEMQNSYNG